MNIGWPEGIYLCLGMLGLGIALAKDGEPRGPHSCVGSGLGFAICLGLLFWGGFFA